MPSHRADTPADAPTALRSPSSAHPTHAPLQRRRDLRTRAAVPAAHGGPAPQQRTHLAGLEWLDVPADEDVEDVLVALQRAGAHLARVVDPGGSTVGVVFLEDVLEELVGEVRDATQRGRAPAARR